MAKKRQLSAREVNLPAALSRVARALETASKQAATLAADFDAGRAKCYRDSKIVAKARPAKRR